MVRQVTLLNLGNGFAVSKARWKGLTRQVAIMLAGCEPDPKTCATAEIMVVRFRARPFRHGVDRDRIGEKPWT